MRELNSFLKVGDGFLKELKKNTQPLKVRAVDFNNNGNGHKKRRPHPHYYRRVMLRMKKEGVRML